MKRQKTPSHPSQEKITRWQNGETGLMKRQKTPITSRGSIAAAVGEGHEVAKWGDRPDEEAENPVNSGAFTVAAVGKVKKKKKRTKMKKYHDMANRETGLVKRQRTPRATTGRSPRPPVARATLSAARLWRGWPNRQRSCSTTPSPRGYGRDGQLSAARLWRLPSW